MKKITILHSSMELGETETSLIGLLKSVDYDIYDVDLLLELKVTMMNLVPHQVNILNTPN